MILCVDFETTSAVDVGDVGAHAYAEHPSTRVLCAVFGDGARVWRWQGGPLPAEVDAWIRRGGPMLAHNCRFERAVWPAGWPRPALEQWHDTQAIGRLYGLPMSLEALAKAVGAPVKKDMHGNAVMRQLAVSVPDGDGWRIPAWSAWRFKRLIEYCETDVLATLACWKKLGSMPVAERRVWLEDQRINDRGVLIDVRAADAMEEMVRLRAEALHERAREVTDGALPNATNPVQTKAWLAAQGIAPPKTAGEETLDAKTVARWRADTELPPVVETVLDLRAEAAKTTSLAKLRRVPTMVSRDGRLRGAMRYCGADTGRWAGSGLQLHNLPRGRKKAEDREWLEWCIEHRDVAALELTEPSVLAALSAALRGLVIAGPGRDLIAADYSAIEARVAAWLAGQQDVLDAFEQGVDIYVQDAAAVGSTDRQFGKVQRLGLNYGMSGLKFVDAAAGYGFRLPIGEAARIVRVWRERNAAIVQWWHDLDNAACDAVRHRGEEFPVGDHLLCVADASCLQLRLPSGRSLRYWRPALERRTKTIKVALENGEVEAREFERDTLTFRAAGPRGMEQDETYGGKLAENASQAVARDLLAESLVRLHGTVYETGLHVHDSVCAEVPAGEGSVPEFCGLLTVVPEWGAGLPLAADGYRAKRFRG